MKRILFSAALLCIMLFIACVQPNVPIETDAKTTQAAQPVGSAAPDSCAAEKPFVLILTRPRLGEWGYEQTTVNYTEFYPENKTKNRPSIFHIAKDPVSITSKKEDGSTLYVIDDVPYICIEKVLTDTEAETWPNNDYYEWSYDRRFFYKYADTSLGPLYRNLNKDSLEVLILEQNNGWQYLLARTDSPLASAETMCIEDFGLIVIEDILFGRAKDFEMLFYANTKGIDGQTVFQSDEPEDILETYGWYYGLNLTFECTRVPGLRYSFRAVPSDDNMKTYVNSRAENGRVMIYGPTILPMDELNEAWEAVALCQD